jgi:hypothetical protein
MTVGLYYSKFFLSMTKPYSPKFSGFVTTSVNYLRDSKTGFMYYPSSGFTLSYLNRSFARPDSSGIKSIGDVRSLLPKSTIPYNHYLVPAQYNEAESFFLAFIAFDKRAFYSNMFTTLRFAVSAPFNSSEINKIMFFKLNIKNPDDHL